MRTFAIGDIHGCHTALTTLLREIHARREDRIVFLGDYIDRGPDSRSVLDRLVGLGEWCSPIYLRGNHEVMVLKARTNPLDANGWRSCGGFEALVSYGAEFRNDWERSIPARHWKFLEQTLPYYETEKHVFVHGCLDPDLEMSEQPEWLLFWENFRQMKPHKSGKKIICGHTPQHSGIINDAGYAACIDTGAAVGGWLTCLDVNSGKYWQANEKAETRAGQLD